MKEPTLADKFKHIIGDDPPHDADMWVWENRDRILAALRAVELVAATTEVFEEHGLFVPTSNLRANLKGFASPADLAKNGAENSTWLLADKPRKVTDAQREAMTDACIARIVREPTDEQGNVIGQAIFDANGHLEGWAACAAIIALANESTDEPAAKHPENV